jgi:hypothetical protein
MYPLGQGLEIEETPPTANLLCFFFSASSLRYDLFIPIRD